nr:nucleotidyltransferase domain-containing protein [Corallococcus exercitus]
MIVTGALSEVFSALSGDSEGVIIFGSFARGDYTEASDIDVIQITPKRKRSYSSGRVSVAVYTQTQLLKMARHGDLFAAHVVREGKIIAGPQALMTEIQSAFAPRASYEGFRGDLRAALPLIDVSPQLYQLRTKRYDSLVQFLLRSWVYSLLADRGDYVFSMREVADRLDDARLVVSLKNERDAGRTWSEFRDIVALTESYFGVVACNPWVTPEAFLVNTEPGLGRILALRLLNDTDVPLEYEPHEQSP